MSEKYQIEKNERPPRFAIRFLQWFCPSHLFESVYGDLMERFEEDCKYAGEKRARWKFIWNVLRFFRPGIVLRNLNGSRYGRLDLVGNHFKVSWRYLTRNRSYTFMNVLGLVIGLGSCIIIVEYVSFEYSYDKFHSNINNLYRIEHHRYHDGKLDYKTAQVFPAVGDALKSTFPQVKEYARLFPVYEHYEPLFQYTDGQGKMKAFHEQKVFAADQSFLEIFDIHFSKGDRSKALDSDHKLVVSESAARKYFGEEDPMNRHIGLFGDDFVITGVFKDLPQNSHFHFEFLISGMKFWEDSQLWRWDCLYTYILMNDGADPSIVEAGLPSIVNANMGKALAENNLATELKLLPVQDIHLHSGLDHELSANGDAGKVAVMGLVAAFILGIALVNYINLSTTRVLRRMKEVSIRKIIGSSKLSLSSQFFIESILLIGISFLLSVLLIWCTTPYIERVVDNELDITIWRNPSYWGIALLCLVATSLLAGFYPARLLSSVNPIQTIKGSVGNAMRGTLVRKGLVVFQFLISISLLAGTLIIYQQVSFMKHADLEFEVNQKLIIKTLAVPGVDSLLSAKLNIFKQEASTYGTVENITTSSSIPGRENEWYGRMSRAEQGSQLVYGNLTRVDENFLEAYGISIISGRGFRVGGEEDRSEVIINEAAAKALNFESPEQAIGHEVLIVGKRKIVGVMKDFHEESLKYPISPSAFITAPGYTKYVTVSLQPGAVDESLTYLENKWNDILAERPFEYFFLDDYFNRQYQVDVQLQRMFNIFSALGVFVAGLGLFGFTLYSTMQRTKEIGVRKILGASALNVTRLLSEEVLFLILLSGLLAAPLVYVLSKSWLSNYSSHIQLHWMHLMLPLIIVVLIAMLSISFHVIKAIVANPVDSLRHE